MAIPPDSLPCTIYHRQPYIIISGIGNISQEQDPLPDTLLNHIHQLPAGDQWASSYIEINDDGHNLASAIQDGTATAISDGSYKDGYGSSCSVLRGHNRTRIITINSVPGPTDSQSAYRSELAGISGSLLVLRAICTKYNISSGSITIGLDGKSAIESTRQDTPLNPCQPDHDLLRDIRYKISQLPISIKWLWIPGHQDDHTSFSQLPPTSQDNIIANDIAKAYCAQLIQRQQPTHNPRFPNEGWTLFLGQHKQTRLNKHKVYEFLTNSDAMNYWTQKLHYPAELTSTIQWDDLGSALHSLNPSMQRHAVKHPTGHFGCGKQLLLWDHQEHDDCPFCQLQEDPKHILRCADPWPTAIWTQSIEKLRLKLQAMNTDPQITSSVLQCLNRWRSGPEQQHYPPEHPAHHQSLLGWYPMLLGQISMQWKSTQATYLLSINSRQSPRRWTVQFIRQLLQISWDMWTHRNGFKHGSDGPDQQQLKERLQDEIKDEYDYGLDGLLPRDHHWLNKPLEHILQLHPATQQQWLSSIANARERYHNQHTVDPTLEQQRTLLRNWLTNNHNNNP